MVLLLRVPFKRLVRMLPVINYIFWCAVQSILPEAVPPPMVNLSSMATTSTPTDCSVAGWWFTDRRTESAVTETSAWYHLL